MAKAKKSKAKKAAKVKKAKAKKPKKSIKKASKKAAPKKARKSKKPPARKAARATTPARKKSKAKKPTPRKKQGPIGEGDYAATRAFDRDQAAFVARNQNKITQMGKDAEKALDGPEGDDLRDAEARAAGRSRDTF